MGNEGLHSSGEGFLSATSISANLGRVKQELLAPLDLGVPAGLLFLAIFGIGWVLRAGSIFGVAAAAIRAKMAKIGAKNAKQAPGGGAEAAQPGSH